MCIMLFEFGGVSKIVYKKPRMMLIQAYIYQFTVCKKPNPARETVALSIFSIISLEWVQIICLNI